MQAPESYLTHVGYVLLPRTPDDLQPDRCPACFTAFTTGVCSRCGLDLGHPDAQQLRDAMSQLSEDLDRRLQLVGRIRYETAQRIAEQAAPAAPAPSPVAAAAAPTAVAPTVEPAVTPPPAAGSPAKPSRAFGVQGVLLTVGAVLLSVAAIFFLIFAFVFLDTLGRSVIILAVTAAAGVGAILLKRRKLPAAAEAVASIAIVLVYLDAWALRESNFAMRAVPAETYWGVVLVLSAIGLVFWHARSGIRIPSIVGYTAIGPGVGLLALEPAQSAGAATASFAFFLGMAVGTFAHVILGRTPGKATFERVTVLSIAMLGLVGSGLAAPGLLPESDWAPAIGLLAVGIAAIVHLVLLTRRGGLPAFGYAFAGLGAVAAASALWSVAPRLDSDYFSLIAPPVAAAIVALALDLAVRTPSIRRFAIVGAWSAAAVAALAALPALATALGRLAGVAGIAGFRGVWSVAGDLALPQQPSQLAALIALAAIVVVVAAGWAWGGVLKRRRAILVWAVAVVLMLAVPVLGMLWPAIAGWSVLAVVALAVLIAPGTRDPLVRVALGVTVGASVLFAYTASWASEHTWLAGTLVAIGVLLGSRLAIRPLAVTGGAGVPSTRSGTGAVKAALLGGAVVVALIGAGALGAWLGDDPASPAQFTMALAILATAAAAFALPRVVTTLDRRVAFWIAVPVGTVAAVATWFAAVRPAAAPLLLQPLTGILLALAAVAALAIWMLRDPQRGLHPERYLASVLATPALVWLADVVLRAVAAPDLVVRLAPAIGVLAAAAASLVIAIVRTADDARLSRDGSAAIVAIGALGLTLFSPALWITLLIVAVAVLLMAVSRDGLFASGSPRRYVGWVALGLATAGLWMRLIENDVADLEPYVLPLAGALLAIAALVARAGRRAAREGEPTVGAGPWIALAGLLVAILPLGAAGASGEPLRALVVAAVSAVLLLAGSLVVGSPRIRPWLDAIALAGAIGVIVAEIGRALLLSIRGFDATAEPEAWLGGAVLLLVVAAFGQARSRGDRAAGIRLAASQALGIVALASVLIVEAFAMDVGRMGMLRALAVVLLFAAVHVIAMLVRRAPLTPLMAWTSLGLGSAAAALGIVVGALDPLESGSIPLALALLATGVVALARAPQARSWPHLGPGLLMLLVPSLLATFTDAPLWRLVALGVVAVALIVIGAIAKLQAPLVIGAVIAIVHGIRTFAPQIVAVYQATEWWLWAAVGGALLLFLGVTFEKRRLDAQAFAAAIARLR